MIDAIEESRMELRGTMLDFEDETEQLRAESRMLEQQRLDYEKNAVDRYLEKKGRKGQGSRASSRISIVNERDDARSRAAVAEYIRRKKDRSGSSLSVHSNPNLRSPSSNDRPVSVISSRSLPTPVMSQKTIEEETDLIMKNMAAADNQMEYQRHRHAEMLEKRRQERAVKKKTTEEKALELLEKAILVDKQLAAKKEMQNKKLQERLDEMKKKKERDMAASRALTRVDDDEMGHTNEGFEDLEKY
uniref:Inner centromere protein A-like n=1 Tax=Crassostrea virginica TaxID=6565 RepID=A0A8B8CBV5_CRAVI|nr:inner centromere protein A-like [Crassostrea virginica]